MIREEQKNLKLLIFDVNLNQSATNDSLSNHRKGEIHAGQDPEKTNTYNGLVMPSTTSRTLAKRVPR
jgi:hypothetical protein